MRQSRNMFRDRWLSAALSPGQPRVRLDCVRQGWSYLRSGQSIDGTPLRLGDRTFESGLGTHADSEIRVTLDTPARQFSACVGVDDNENSKTALLHGAAPCVLIFSMDVDGSRIWQSPPLTVLDPPVRLDLTLNNAQVFTLRVEAVDGRNNFAHADWADARVELADGSMLPIGDSLDRQRLPQSPIFSFLFDGKPSHTLLPNWNVRRDTITLSEVATEHRMSYTDPSTGLACVLELISYGDCPAVEWVVRFRNEGDTDTPLIEAIQAMDAHWVATAGTRLHRSRGSRSRIDDFAYQWEDIEPDGDMHMTSGEGRSSTDWLPFFNLQTGGDGVVCAIGWSGHWAARFARDEYDGMTLRAGLERTRLVLHPGEEIRTPRIALVFWDGQSIDGSNLLRRFLIRHHTPKANGQIVTAPISTALWGGIKTGDHLRAIALAKKQRLPYDTYWIDAGWYGTPESYSAHEFDGTWYEQVGNWEPNPVAHPDGLTRIGDAACDAGLRFLLWFEPERAIWGTKLTQEHPEWFFGERGSNKSVLLDLGNPDARSWAIEEISRRITDWGIGFYRQDFNFDPLPYWRANDAPNRQGMTEIRHIQGLYAFWDELLRLHPGLMIDNCASGGRRLDLELISRSLPLWRSDYQCNPGCDSLGAQNHTAGLSYWVPLSGTSAHLRAGDTYNFRSALSAAIGFPSGPEDPPDGRPPYPWDWHRAMMAQHARARPFYYGDYYPLTRFSSERDCWFVYQMHRTDLGAGFILAFRREECPYSSAQFLLAALGDEPRWRLENADSGGVWTATGQELAQHGLSLTLAQPRDSILIFYRHDA